MGVIVRDPNPLAQLWVGSGSASPPRLPCVLTRYLTSSDFSLSSLKLSIAAVVVVVVVDRGLFPSLSSLVFFLF